MDPSGRREAIEALIHNPNPWIRQRALRAGAAILPDTVLVEYLRNSSDDIMRNMGLEIIKLKGHAALGLAIQLLRDQDPDVVLQAVLVLDHLRDLRALEPLRLVLSHPNPNVVQATIVAIGQLGDERIIIDILAFLQADPWLQMAAVQALGNLRSSRALNPLKKLLPDLFIGPMAAEAIARIGGPKACRILTDYWLTFRHELDPEPVLGLMSHVIEGLTTIPSETLGLLESIAPFLDEVSDGLRLSAARCLLGLGPAQYDTAALEVVASQPLDSSLPYPCLFRRPDLIPSLLGRGEPFRVWGFHLLVRHPGRVPVADILPVLSSVTVAEAKGPVLSALSKLRDPGIVPALLDLYLRMPVSDRDDLVPLLKRHRAGARELIAARADIDAAARVVLNCHLGALPSESAKALESLTLEERVEALGQLTASRSVLRLLPWEAWLKEAPEAYAQTACDAATRSGLKELLGPLRSLLETQPKPFLVEAIGQACDRRSIPILERLLEGSDTFMRALIIEALGSIGGPDARRILKTRVETAEGRESVVAYRALAHCAIEDDLPLFQAATQHPEWMVRLASVQVLERHPSPDNFARLAMLAADTSSAVAKLAASALSNHD
jgi:HEAT repeat protein